MIDFAAITRRSKLLGRICRIPLNMIPKGTVVPIMQGPLRGMRWVVGAGLHSFWLGGYEADKQRLMSKYIKPGTIFYDIGTSVGFYTLFGAHFVQDTGHVYGFEPVPQNANYVRKHIEYNHLKNVDLFQMALSDFDGVTRFREGLNEATGKIDPAGGLEVKVGKLDTLIANGTIKPASVVKIDVEGAEYAVLQGAEQFLKAHKPRIFLATHGDEVHEQCVAYLSKLGYQLEPFRSIDGGGEIHAY
jgi:FkbM family methyltransferase